MAVQNLTWFIALVTWVMGPGWADTIWSIEVMAQVLVSEGFMIDLHECLPLVLNGLLWDFPNIQVKQRGSFLILLSFLGIIPLLNILRRNFK